MAGSPVITDVNELEKQRLGYIAISLTTYVDGAEPEITAGSKIEIASGLYEFTANEDIDVANAHPGLADGNIYCYINPATVVPYLSSTAPAWDDAKQGYYLAASPTHRCWAKFIKPSYADFSILVNRLVGLRNAGLIVFDSISGENITLTQVQQSTFNDNTYWTFSDAIYASLYNYNINDEASILTVTNETIDFEIRWPISCYFKYTSGSYDVSISQDGGFRSILAAQGATVYNQVMLPGLYRISNATGVVDLWCSGIYGRDTITTTIRNVV